MTMRRAYGIISDTHHHNWSAFSTVTEKAVNSRLQVLLDEAVRCAGEVTAAGGNTIVHAGDLFHVRGSIAPSVLVPTLDCYSSLVKAGMNIIIVAGNHDLEGKESNRIGSAITAMEGIGCKVVNTAIGGLTAMDGVAFVPWTPDIEELKKKILQIKAYDHRYSEIDVVIHAPIDGVIMGIPDHGLDAAWLAGVGFRRVFAGHYHNFKDFGNGVYSIGALAHHTWSDVGTQAGYLIVKDSGVTRRASHAPSFVEITAETDPDEIPLIVDGNYVRAKLNTSKATEVEETRAYLNECKAKGVVIIAERESTISKRDGATITAGASLEVSINDYIKARGFGEPTILASVCANILDSARAVE